MKKSALIFIIIFLLFALYSISVKNDVRGNSVLAYSGGDKLESYVLPNIDGETVSIDSVIAENRYVWINFWASWCGPCRREMPMMAELYNKFRDQGFDIVAINVGESREAINDYLDAHPVPFPVYTDIQRRISNEFNIESLPTSFLVDSTGTVQRVGIGVQESWEYAISRKLRGDDE